MSEPERVLLVDDELSIRRTLCRALERNGFRVTAVASGGEALQALEEGPYGVVITDLAMEGVGGLQVLDRARQRDPDCCVIVMTGFNDSGSAVEALRLGAEDYVAKPFDYDELLLRVARCAQRRQLLRRVRLYEEFLPLCRRCRRLLERARSADAGNGNGLAEAVYRELCAGADDPPERCPACLHRGNDEE